MIRFASNSWLTLMSVAPPAALPLVMLASSFPPIVEQVTLTAFGTLLLFDGLFFTLALAAVFVRAMTDGGQRFGIATLFILVAVFAVFFGVYVALGPHWTFAAIASLLGAITPCQFVRYGSDVRSKWHAVARGCLANLMLTFVICAIFVSWMGFEGVGTRQVFPPVNDLYSALMCGFGALLLMGWGAVTCVPMWGLLVISAISSLRGYNLRQRDDMAAIAADHSFRPPGEDEVSKLAEEQSRN